MTALQTNAADQLRIQYDFLSKTVLLEYGGKSHVLESRFDTKESAERAARHYAQDSWGYAPPAAEKH